MSTYILKKVTLVGTYNEVTLRNIYNKGNVLQCNALQCKVMRSLDEAITKAVRMCQYFL